MKKLMVMLGAVAMAFGLFADAQPYAMSFETQAEGVTDLNWTPGSEWSGLTGPLALTTGERTLPYTGSTYDAESNPTGRRDSMFNGLGTNNNWLDLSTGSDALTLTIGSGNKVVDQLVKFTGFEDAPELTDGKIAVWMSEFFTNEDETEATTNLFVSCAKVSAGGVEQVNIKIDGDYELGKWYHVTIFSIGDIYDNAENHRAGFKVFVDGVQAVAAEGQGADTLVYDAALMTKDAKALMAKGALFPAIDDTSLALASVSYKGIGAIDDIIVDENGPAFRTDIAATVAIPANTIVAITDKDGNEVEVDQTTGAFAVDPSLLPITVTWTAKPGWVMKPVVKEFTELTDGQTIPADDVKPQEEVCTVSVDGAKAVGYASFEDGFAAIAAAEEQGVKDFDVVIKRAGSTLDGAYTFAAGVGITIGEWMTEDDEPVAIGSQWDIFGGNVTCTTGVENRKFVNFDSGDVDVYALTLGGTVKPGAVVQAATFAAGANLALEINDEEGAAQIITKATLDVSAIGAPTGYKVVANPGEDDLEDWTIYTLEEDVPEIDYVSFTVAAGEEIASFTVTTNNGVAVALIDDKYTVESNALVTVAATAKDGYKNVTITGGNVTVDQDGKFTASEAESVITIDAEAIVLTATFVDEDGETELYKDEEVAYNTTPEYKGATPTKTGYTFAGWTPALGPITENATYKATYTANNYGINYTWVDNDGASVTALENTLPTQFTFDGESITLVKSMVTLTEAYTDVAFAPATVTTDEAKAFEVTVTLTKKAEDPTPDPIKDPDQKAAYKTWTDTIATFAKGHTEAVYADYFALKLTDEEVAAAGNDPAKAASDKLAAEITPAMVAALAAGTAPAEVDYSVPEGKYENASFIFVATDEITAVPGVSAFYRLTAVFKPAND